MANLHLFANRMSNQQLREISSVLAEQDDIFIFIGEATTNLIDSELPQIEQTLNALRADCECRGITDLLNSGINLIEDTDWISISAKATKIISW
ncbi:MAG: DsrH/TusB family sulfur metabolism protein [Kangiellaceae bacterium]|nr:DsrH/TusB family sulfur metabolism protein [Kangiellaceae bacterium]MCW9018127.1 DsrH/TusB family sulfur metabolism protein [Kangiellaceae bacterium]